MNEFDRTTRPARFAVKFYKTNPDDVDPPLDTLAIVDLRCSDEQTAIKDTRRLARLRKHANADSWELIERAGIEWDMFDAANGLGSWEWRERTVLDSWEDK